MRELSIGKNLTWIILVEPKKKDIETLRARFNIHPIILDELLAPSDRSKVERYDNYVFLVYHLPIYRVAEQTSRRSEIDCIATKHAVVTVMYEKLEPLAQLEQTLMQQPQKNIKTTAQLLYHILEEANNFSVRQLKHVERKVNFFGDQLFSTKRHDRSFLETISYIKRDLLDFSIIAIPQQTTLESLVETGVKFWGEQHRVYFVDLVGGFMKIQLLLGNLKATIDSYSETISQLFEFKTSEIIRRFSILGFLTFPLILYATIALQPTVEKSIIRTAHDYWAQLIVIGIFVVTLAAIFRKKGWL